MRPGQFIPARSPRHRQACIALFRALVRQGQRVPLPSDLAAAAAELSPIRELVRRQFARNRADVSPRIVYAALSAGYKVFRP